MANKKTSEPKAFEAFDLTLAAVIKPGGDTVHYLLTLDGVEVQPATCTAALADAPEVIEGLITTLEEGYARYLTEQIAQAAKKTRRSSKKPAAVTKPQEDALAAPTEEDEQPETAEAKEEEVVADAVDKEQPEAPKDAEQEGDEEDTPEETPAPPTEQLSMLDGIDI